ncbi:MAG: baseplate multidomain protein megatron [Pseudomonadota bacterium]
MAALVLSAVGGSLGGKAFGIVGAFGGRIAGAIGGNLIDRALFGGGKADPKTRNIEGPRLTDLDVMAASEGTPVPRVYGRARLSGQVIWATRLEEVVSTRSETSGGGTTGGRGGKGDIFNGDSGGGGGATTPATVTTTTTYAYYANFAVGLCEGVIARIGRVWADGKPLDTAAINFRVYRGDEAQEPDGLIVAKEGAGNAPAYRGLAYVVFEHLPLAEFGNRIPQLSFEIIRPIGRLETMVRAVTLIPGTTEFGYDTETRVQLLGPGQSAPENRHVTYASNDVLGALDDLQAICPQLERIALVVAWFGNDLRAGECVVQPGVDNALKQTSGAPWSVAGATRAGAHLVSLVDGRPAFGGTPSDDTVIRLIDEIKRRGLKVTLYPFVMMDVPADNGRTNPYTGTAPQPPYPWRGRITCDPAPGQPGSPQGTATAAAQVANFFATYRPMVLHYANLSVAAGGVHAFLIGSELAALTRVRSGAGIYPAVEHLVSLAAEVKAIVGSATVTYGADWTEYGAHVIDDDASEVRFPLDPLWASGAIDAVGIDYYAPLADWRDEADHLDAAIASSTYDLDYLGANLSRGQAYDWYYPDAGARADQDRVPITDGLGKPWTFRQKDLWNWWSNAHYERVAHAELGSPTAWVPRSKPIWLTEIGCPAVDKGANQPSVFPDPKSSESFFPYFSNAQRDDLIQRRMLEAALKTFDPAFGANDVFNPVSPLYGERMIDPSAIHLWTWDARPYPVFPVAEDIWSDAGNWRTGHWLTGRLGSAPLDDLVAAILRDSNVTGADTSGLRDSCDGYVVDRPMPPRAMIEPLAMAYAFDATAADGTLRFVQRGGRPVAEIGEDDLVAPDRGSLAQLTRSQETELPREVSFGYTDATTDYRRAAVTSRRLVGGSNRTTRADFSIVTDDAAASRRSDIWLQDLWAGRENAEFALGAKYLALTPGDVIGLTVNGRRRLVEIDALTDTQSRQVRARSIDPEVFSVPLSLPRRRTAAVPHAIGPVRVEVLDLPALELSMPPVLTRLAVFADPWPGSVNVWRSLDGASFDKAAVALAPSIMGETLDPLPRGPTSRWDHATQFRVKLYGGGLTSVSDAKVLESANAAAVRTADGVWEVLQFAHAELMDERTYRLSRLLRGQAGSEYAIAELVPAGAPFVLLDDHLVPIARGLGMLARPLSLRIAPGGRSHSDPAAVAVTVTPRATAIMPLSPVHLTAARAADGIHLRWIRRARVNGDNWAIEPPLGEDSEAYVAEILSGAAVVRRLEVTSPAAIYTTADELADFGAPLASLHVRIAQVSAQTGPGHLTEATLNL